MEIIVNFLAKYTILHNEMSDQDPRVDSVQYKKFDSSVKRYLFLIFIFRSSDNFFSTINIDILLISHSSVEIRRRVSSTQPSSFPIIPTVNSLSLVTAVQIYDLISTVYLFKIVI